MGGGRERERERERERTSFTNEYSSAGRLTDIGAPPAGSALLVRTISMQSFYTVMTSVGARMGTAVIAGHAIARQVGLDLPKFSREFAVCFFLY